MRNDTASWDRLHAYVPDGLPEAEPDRARDRPFRSSSGFPHECWDRLRLGQSVSVMQSASPGWTLSGGHRAVNKTVSGLRSFCSPIR